MRTTYRDAGKRRVGGIPFHRRHRRLIVTLVAVLVVVPVLGTAAYAYVLNTKLNGIDKVEKKLPEADRPDPDEGDAINILLIGSDKGKKIPGESGDTSIAEDAKADEWPAGKYRSDTMMVVHVTANRKYAFLTSIPRDTLTTIYDEQGRPQGMSKVNAAFSDYGPLGTQSTVEHLTGIRMQHFAIIDWAGFKDLSRAVGGVPVTIPRSFYDPQQKIQWEAGEQVLEGEQALSYVRTRYGLLRGDFDRIARQQNFLRAMMKKVLSKGTMRNPVKLVKTVSALTENLTVDGEWSGGDMRGLALSLRGVSTEDVIFLTAPVAGTETIDPYGSIARLDEAKTAELFDAYRKDNLRAYLKKYPDDVLKGEDEVS
ncbi:LCP family protein [Aeromicrobium stalagmiti]|uniref:LCP family protein n=1 Tax=Aeromicrobium stalagmiti TaxID=2738988 RepID=UPI0015681A58|nr:LCP family protein [Aeromicrobium stalagmiti]NRQ48477.1 LCP family protein [Aeromicrobium stalagmiti]